MKRIEQVAPWYGAEEKRAMAEYLEAGGWLTEFKKTAEFQQMIASYVGSKYASVVNNGTVSLVTALFALGIGKGDEVIVPDYTMIASSNAIVFAGATPKFVDINPETLCLDLKLTEKAITKKTKAIMYVNINGRSPEMARFAQLAQAHKVFLVEDAAQALGSTYQGKALGTFGAIGSYSFSPHKIITTGQGGALVTDSEEAYSRIVKFRDFGRTKSGVDYHDTQGLNFKFTDLQAVIGVEQMKKIDTRVQLKKKLFATYQKMLKDTAQVEFIKTNLEDCAPWFIDVLVDGKQTRDNLAAFLKERGVSTRPFYPAIHTQPPYAGVKGDFPNSVSVSERGLWLPSSAFLTEEDIDYVCSQIKDFFKTRG